MKEREKHNIYVHIAYIYKLIPEGSIAKACIRTGWKQVSIFFLSNMIIKLGEDR